MRDVGLDVEWHVIYGREEFFNATKVMHNALQGNPQDLTDEQWEAWRALQRDERARAVARAGTSASSTTRSRPRCTRSRPRSRATGSGAATSTSRRPIPRTIERLLPYDPARIRASVFHIAAVRAGGHGRQGPHRAARDRPARAEEHGASRRRTPSTSASSSGSTSTGRCCCQVSRFDPWKDPLGVIDAYRVVKEQIPDVQLALVGSMATDDPEGWDFFNATIAHADGDPDIHILNNFNNVGAIEVNAFQSHADVRDPEVDARGLRADRLGGDLEGAPVHRRQRRRHPAAGPGRRHRLPRRQRRGVRRARHARSSPTPASAAQLGRAGKEHVRRHFLMPRLLRDWLRIFTRAARRRRRMARRPPRSCSSPTAAR